MLALLPIKSLHAAKRRLAGMLTAAERQRFCEAMAGDVLNMLTQHASIDRVVLCSSDPGLQSLARRFDAEFLPEDELGSSGLNATVNAAARRFAQQGVTELLSVHGDLPMLRAAEIDEILRAHRNALHPALTINPDRHGTGSNLLLWNPADLADGRRFETEYGAGSFERHRHATEALGMTLAIVRTLGGGLDIDEPDDLIELVERIQPRDARLTYAFLESSELIAHLRRPGDAGALTSARNVAQRRAKEISA